jgi:hypothetical protein
MTMSRGLIEEDPEKMVVFWVGLECIDWGYAVYAHQVAVANSRGNTDHVV